MIAKIKLLIAILLALPITIQAQNKTLNPKFEQKIESLISKKVTTISCERLKERVTTPNLYILDAREKNEYEVSHLKDAKWIGYNKVNETILKTIPKDAIVVVYCSIGYRSGVIGEKLQKKGYQRVYNLYGGIFEWSNKGYPMVNQTEEKTPKVHAYNKSWGQWVEKGEKVY
jgi:rhodanese-related sulfurtransferase